MSPITRAILNVLTLGLGGLFVIGIVSSIQSFGLFKLCITGSTGLFFVWCLLILRNIK